MEQAPWGMARLAVAAVAEEDRGMALEHQLIVFARNAGKRYPIKLDFHAQPLNVLYVRL